MKHFFLEVRVCADGHVHDLVRFVQFAVSESVATAIWEAGLAKQGRNIRRRGDVPTVRLDEAADWLNSEFRSVRPMFLPGEPSIVTVQNNGTFKLMNLFGRSLVCSEAVSINEMMEAMRADQPQPIVLFSAQQALNLQSTGTQN